MPTPATYGLPQSWGHLRYLLEQVGFAEDEAHDELHRAGELAHIPPPGEPPIEGLWLHRGVGNLATRFSAQLEECESIGYFHLTTDLTRGGALSALAGWADVWELQVDPAYRRRGVGTWLVRHGVAWALLGRCDRILLTLGDDDVASGVPECLATFGWQEISRTRRGWSRPVSGTRSRQRVDEGARRLGDPASRH
jgi:GNAT superfamily N-acetyltransferase